MRTRQHRQRGIRVRELAQLRDCAVECGQQHAVACVAQHQRVGEIVDVLAGAGEVNELFRLRQFGVVADALLDEIFDRLDVVVGRALDFLDLLAVDRGKRVGDRAQFCPRRGGERRDFDYRFFIGERLEPAHFDENAPLHQTVLAEDRAQGLDLGGDAMLLGKWRKRQHDLPEEIRRDALLADRASHLGRGRLPGYGFPYKRSESVSHIALFPTHARMSQCLCHEFPVALPELR